MTRDSDIYLRHSIRFWCRAVCQFFENGLQIVRISERIHRLHARHNVNKQRAHSHLHRILNSHRRWERDNRHPKETCGFMLWRLKSMWTERQIFRSSLSSIYGTSAQRSAHLTCIPPRSAAVPDLRGIRRPGPMAGRPPQSTTNRWPPATPLIF